jgi:hypothetical protein
LGQPTVAGAMHGINRTKWPSSLSVACSPKPDPGVMRFSCPDGAAAGAGDSGRNGPGAAPSRSLPSCVRPACCWAAVRASARYARSRAWPRRPISGRHGTGHHRTHGDYLRRLPARGVVSRTTAEPTARARRLRPGVPADKSASNPRTRRGFAAAVFEAASAGSATSIPNTSVIRCSSSVRRPVFRVLAMTDLAVALEISSL